MPTAVRPLTDHYILNVFANYDSTIAATSISAAESPRDFFELWRTSSEAKTSEDDLASSKSPIRTSNTRLSRLKRSSPKRRRGNLSGPILVTNQEKVFKFRGAKGDAHVTVFVDKGKESYSEGKVKEQYEKFWLQNYSPFKVVDKGKIFFGDKNQPVCFLLVTTWFHPF
eukprot:TRINITY_DN14574_c0_g1_i4.p3 TRINITY_DN14574_c0_g1~~TRINITY_DN14574_c0_g1_i4.p3  ORF type:complete len:169 (+),score=16.06 TRINITY_DN14574_c0_g1_i4:1745-2251(+)